MNRAAARKLFFLCIFTVLFLSGCGGAPTLPPAPPVINVSATTAAQPWLVKVYGCAETQGMVINVSATTAAQPWLVKVYGCAETQGMVIRLSAPEAADLRLRIGAPENLDQPVFQIGSETLEIVTRPDSALQSLTEEEARTLFSRPQVGQALQVWVYADGEDVQQVFLREALHGAPVSSLARVAVSPQDMSMKISASAAAVGILPQTLTPATLRVVFRLPETAVLAIPSIAPPKGLGALVACLQQKTAP
jgi:hypothetical protein